MLALVRERPHDASGRSSATTGTPVRTAVTTYPFWLLVVVLFVSSIAQNGALAHLPALLSDRGVGSSGAAAALSAMGAASLLGRLTTGWFLDRYWAAYVSCALLTMAAGGVLLLASAHSFGQGVLAAALIGFGMGGEADVTPYLLARYFGLRSFATLYGWTWTAYAWPAPSVRSSWAAPSMHRDPTRASWVDGARHRGHRAADADPAARRARRHRDVRAVRRHRSYVNAEMPECWNVGSQRRRSAVQRAGAGASIFAGWMSVGMNWRSTRSFTSRRRSRMPAARPMSAICCISSSSGVSIR